MKPNEKLLLFHFDHKVSIHSMVYAFKISAAAAAAVADIALVVAAFNFAAAVYFLCRRARHMDCRHKV